MGNKSIWAWFIGDGRDKLKLTVKPEPYTFDKSERWLIKQVFPTLKTVMNVDILQDTNILDDAFRQTKISDKHKKLLKQMGTSLNDLIIHELPVISSDLHDMDDELYD